jgi:hypothetical protein
MKLTTKNTLLALIVSAAAALTGATGQPDQDAAVDPTKDLLAQTTLVSGLIERANAESTVTRRLRLEGGVQHHVVVQGDGDTDLDAVLIDQHGNVVASDLDSTDFCILSLIPRSTGEFTLEIHNLGNVFNQYVITVL